MTANLQPIADFIVRELQDELRRQGKIASGQLISSIQGIVERLVDGWVIEINTGSITYGKFVDWGRKGNPSYEFGQGNGAKSKMFEALLKWARIRKSTLSASKQRSFAFMAMRKIKKYGIKPTNFVGNVLKTDDVRIRQMIEDALGSYYQILVRNIVQEQKYEYI
jgi:hypothetical protein